MGVGRARAAQQCRPWLPWVARTTGAVPHGTQPHTRYPATLQAATVGMDMSSLFPSMTSCANLSADDLVLKKMLYLYITHYAAQVRLSLGTQLGTHGLMCQGDGCRLAYMSQHAAQVRPIVGTWLGRYCSTTLARCGLGVRDAGEGWGAIVCCSLCDWLRHATGRGNRSCD